MTDRFDEAAREIGWILPDGSERIRLTEYGVLTVAQALRDNWNAAIDAAAATLDMGRAGAYPGHERAERIRALKEQP